MAIDQSQEIALSNMKWVWTRDVFPTWNESEIVKIAHNPQMRTIMTTTNLKTIEALEAFLEGNQLTAFAVPGNKTQRYNFVRKTLVKFGYMSLSKKRQRRGHSIADKNDRLLTSTTDKTDSEIHKNR